jgi:hypothetical protein
MVLDPTLQMDHSILSSRSGRTPNHQQQIISKALYKTVVSRHISCQNYFRNCPHRGFRTFSLITILAKCAFLDYLMKVPDLLQTCNSNWTRYPVSEHDFRASYTSVCANGIGANPNDVRFLPLLFVVLSIAVRLAPEHVAGDARTRRLTSLRYYWSCMFFLS